jgi:hypothetical protein
MLGQLILWLESDPEWVTGESEPTNPEPTNLRT